MTVKLTARSVTGRACAGQRAPHLTVVVGRSRRDILERARVLVASAIALLPLLWSCASPDHTDPRRSVSTLDKFVDGSWQFRVDRSWSGAAQFPLDPLAEADYQAVEKAVEYLVDVSEHASRITISTQRDWTQSLRSPLKGRRTLSTEFVAYDLREGTPAAGRFLVWLDERGLQAELTIYGSGVPIVLSQRGSLVQRL
jgi:hypothetical protein